MDDYENYTYEDYPDDFLDGKDATTGYPQREALHMVSVVIYSVAFVLGVLGNGVVVWVMATKSRRTVNSVWLLNLAVADLVFVLFLPFSIDYVLRGFHWSFGLAMCKLNSFVSVMNMYASVLLLTALSLDRYISLVHLSWSGRFRTVRRAWAVCGALWVAAALLSLPALMFRDTMELHFKVICFNNFHEHDPNTAAARHGALVLVRTVVGFLLPFSAISISGVLLAVRLRRPDSARLSSFSKTVAVIIVAFFLCWAPFHTLSLMELAVSSSPRLHAVLHTGFPLVTSLAFFNSCVNPLLYVLLTKNVRSLLKHSALRLTKRSLRELSQPISATESVSLPTVLPAVEPTTETRNL